MNSAPCHAIPSASVAAAARFAAAAHAQAQEAVQIRAGSPPPQPAPPACTKALWKLQHQKHALIVKREAQHYTI